MGKTYAAGDQLTAADYNGIVPVAGSYAVDAGGDDTYAITVAPVPTDYDDGDEYTFKSSTANTGAATLNVNALGAKSIFRADGSALANGDIAANMPVRVKYDGTNFRIISALANMPKYANGISTRTLDAASSIENIAHGLGRSPRIVRIHAEMRNSGGDASSSSFGVYNGVTVARVTINRASTTNGGTSTSTSTILELSENGGGSPIGQNATITVDATNIILNWTKVGTPGAHDIRYVWEAEA